MLENLRRSKGEERNDPVFARELAALADIFVQDSLDTCHRVHASIVGVSKLLPSYAGLLFEEEIEELSHALTPKHPAVAIIGGAKFNTKEEVLTTLLTVYDHVFVGGALANDFLKAAGQEVGKSLVSHGNENALQKLLASPKLVLPVDSLTARTAGAGYTQGEVRRHTFRVNSASRISPMGQVLPNEIILDHGPGTIALLADLTQKAKTILWNGPLGKYEGDLRQRQALLCALSLLQKLVRLWAAGTPLLLLKNLVFYRSFHLCPQPAARCSTSWRAARSPASKLSTITGEPDEFFCVFARNRFCLLSPHCSGRPKCARAQFHPRLFSIVSSR